MLRTLRNTALLLTVVVLLASTFEAALAARGTPGSPEFGFGALVYPQGSMLDDSLSMAAALGLDWIAVPVSWNAFQPRAAEPPQFAVLTPVMQFAAENKVAVLVSVSNAPAWARTEQGPDPTQSALFVAALLQQFPATIQAVELFPGANTIQGWGSRPNPEAYLTLYNTVREQALLQNPSILMVGAGLRPIAPASQNGDMDDLAFLQSLYKLGAQQVIPVISMQLFDLTGDTLLAADRSEPRVLRHYEDVRAVMTANQHHSGIIWITHLCAPSGTINVLDSQYRDPTLQSNWMRQALLQLRSQLYIGAVFLQSLNPETEGAAGGIPSLIRSDGTSHPLFSDLAEMISLNSAGSPSIVPGKTKDGNLGKNRP